jgi:hypothetical protein
MRPQTTPTVHQPASALSTVTEAANAQASTQRLDKELATAALQVVVEQLLVSNLVNVNHARITAFADDETLGAARTLYTCIVERMLCEHVMCEVERRGLLPVTINTLSSLVCEALALYKLK